MDKQQAHIRETEGAFASIQIEEEEQGGLTYENSIDELSEIEQDGEWWDDSLMTLISISKPWKIRWRYCGDKEEVCMLSR